MVRQLLWDLQPDDRLDCSGVLMSDTQTGVHVFSPSTLAFYPVALQPVYENAGTWPADTVAVTEATFQTYGLSAAPIGQKRGADANGQPIWVDLPEPPPLTLQQQASAMLMQPVAVQSTSMPELNASYPIDQTTQGLITGIAAQINAGLGLPGGDTTFNWSDATGTPHQWPAPQFTAFAKEVMHFAYACTQVAQGHSETLPETPLTIP
jgi:hypothetical protein